MGQTTPGRSHYLIVGIELSVKSPVQTLCEFKVDLTRELALKTARISFFQVIRDE
jgi:hypothetical protein